MGDNLEIPRGGDLCLSKAGLGIGSDTAKAETNAPDGGSGFYFAINGILRYEADGGDSIVMSGDNQTTLYTNIYLAQINAGGTLSVVQGKEVLTEDLDEGRKTLAWPVADADYVAIGGIIVEAGDSEFVPGTTALTGGDATVTYVDLMAVPEGPIESSTG